jgi:folate-binding Fe-S cluster repair protein YgfZ
VFPPEVGFVAAVSYDKGCYLGQEPLSRLHLRGRANRGLIAVAPAAGTVEATPTELADAEGPVGRLTTWAAPADAGAERPAGLAIVHRRAFAPGTTLTTASGATVVVIDGPHGDDPGTGARRR